MNNKELIAEATRVAKKVRHNGNFISGEVGAALVTDKGTVYIGKCINSNCGFCAEASAIATMVSAGETRIEKIVAIDCDGKILPPCGKCREFMAEVDKGNQETKVILTPTKTVTLKKLLPHPWQKVYNF